MLFEFKICQASSVHVLFLLVSNSNNSNILQTLLLKQDPQAGGCASDQMLKTAKEFIFLDWIHDLLVLYSFSWNDWVNPRP